MTAVITAGSGAALGQYDEAYVILLWQQDGNDCPVSDMSVDTVTFLYDTCAALKYYPELRLTFDFPPSALKTLEDSELEAATTEPASLMEEKLSSLVSVYREFQNKAVIEIGLGLLYHPVLPLICDTDVVRDSMPQAVLPENRYSYPEDAMALVIRGMSLYKKFFYRYPKGMFSARPCASAPSLGVLCDSGLEWLALPGELLAKSGGRKEESTALCQPYYVLAGERRISIFFYDNVISAELNDPAKDCKKRVDWLMYNIEYILKDYTGNNPPVITVVLDARKIMLEGENRDKFIGYLYRRLSSTPGIRTITPSSYLELHNPQVYIENIFPGEFDPWIGEKDENKAWDYLYKARDALNLYKNSGRAKIDELDRAFSNIYAAEGGVWFFWYGDDNPSAPDDRMDGMYRKFLSGVYENIGKEPPLELSYPIFSSLTAGTTSQVPTAMQVEIIKVRDQRGDNYGPGSYTYPINALFKKEYFDFLSFEVRKDTAHIILCFELALIENCLSSPSGLGPQIIDVYIDLNRRSAAGSIELLPLRNAFTSTEDAWEYAVTVNAYKQELYKFNPEGVPTKVANLSVKIEKNFLSAYIPRSLIRGEPENWGYIPVMLSQDCSSYKDGVMPEQDIGRINEVRTTNDEWHFGGGAEDEVNTNILDTIMPAAGNEKEILKAFMEGKVIQLPALRKSR